MSNLSVNDVLTFNLNYKVTKKVKKGFLGFRNETQETVILNDVKGRIESGTMTALLGASGCGKTTLLAALSQRLRGKLIGEIRFNGEVIDRSKMTNISSFVAQSDVALEGLTVREHFHFMIELKVPKMSAFEKSRLSESSLTKFGLKGSTKLKFLSGGEKRKLSLASELLTKPQILFCDEPTSGLDSFSAFSVMNTLRELSGYSSNNPKQISSSSSRIILFSIHQPTSDIFQLFTNVILMKSGRIIFHGSVQEAENLFTNMGMPCPPRYNPAEFYVKRISDAKVSDDIIKRVGVNEEEKLNEENKKTSSHYDENLSARSKASWLRQVYLLSQRTTLNFLHDPKHYLIEFLILIVFALIITAVYSGISFESQAPVQDIKGFLIVVATEILFVFVYAVFMLIYEVLPLLRKEIGNRLYSLSAYYVSIVLLSIPRVFLETLIFTAIIYFPTDIGRDFITYLRICLSVSMSGICAMAYGFFLSGLFESFLIGTELSAILDLVLILAAGVYINVRNVPFLKYASFFYYANECVAIDFWLTVDDIKCSRGFNCYTNGTAVLESLAFGTTEYDVYKNYLYQFILTFMLHVMAFLGIRKNVRRTGFY
ncbi:CLUMA_CG021332, isoform A [Clunio marinus]|uniref:CLUMA_CG021332, isoform A n=1 Tax=Clunio marinus TaxID=568069 RepID=A0A1J1J8K5_9DIPT|nr:CLUMA_CG021332, isoform A [Clunio marinus]